MNIIAPLFLAITLGLAIFIHPGFLFLPGLPILVMQFFWVTGWQRMETDRDQLDCVLDMFHYPTKWVSDGNCHAFNDFVRLIDGSQTMTIQLGHGGPVFHPNRFYRKAIRAKLFALDDWRQIKSLYETIKDADHAQSLLEPAKAGPDAPQEPSY